MANKDLNASTNRRRFLGSLATGAAAMSIATIPSLNLHAEEANTPVRNADDPDAWFDKVKGKHRILYDVPKPHEIFPFAWPKVFLLTNQKTGTPPSDCGVVVVLRHSAMCYAFDSALWAKYNFGDMCKVEDPVTHETAKHNPFQKPGPEDFKIPGIGAVQIGIPELQADGVMFCVCDMAITVYSAVAAGQLKKEPADVKKEWLASVLPGIQVVPSGVWAVGRAQEHGCHYCFAG